MDGLRASELYPHPTERQCPGWFAYHDEAAGHCTAAINTGALSDWAIRSKYKVFVLLFGWNLRSMWEGANQRRCHALLRAGRIIETREAYPYMMDVGSKTTKASCRDWSIGKSSVMSTINDPSFT
ncbi:hypothetical protein M405DRAFT_234847 [Rhizopogon salebrosus TDB-379]|nr:hypothetical protein M405DRAFT_234847 [Rhizopogon salebrosus TDB-379]